MRNCKEWMEKLSQQSELYKPGPFWETASLEMVKELNEKGLKKFRSLESSLSFFVPTYRNELSAESIQQLKTIGYDKQLTPKQQIHIQQFISGYSAALADYRVLAAAESKLDRKPNIMQFSESQIGEPVEQFEIQGCWYSLSSLNYLLGITFLKRYLSLDTINTVLEIGGGFGTLGEIFHKTLPQIRYINIDIPPTLCCSIYYLNELVGADYFTDATLLPDHQSAIDILSLKKISVLPSWDISRLKGEIDLFVNFISFQEMEPNIVENYLNHVKRLNTKWLLLRNLREGKQIRTATNIGVERPILSEDYQKMLDGYQLVDRNVIPFGQKKIDGYHSELMLFCKD